ncbi:MAG: hypothetical protein ACOCX5_04125 [Chloroflexota bacterium]
MYSLRIWQALMRPFVAHPVYQRRGVWKPDSVASTRGLLHRLIRFFRRHEGRIYLMLITLIISLMIIFGFWNVFLFLVVVPFVVFLLLLPLGLLLMGFLHGLLSGFAIGDTITNEKLQGRYMLLGLTPYGFEGATWALCSLSIHGHPALRRVRMFARALYFLLLAIVGIPFFYTVLLYIMEPSSMIGSIFRDMTLAALIVLTLASDFLQSTNVGSIIGMLAPTYTRTRTDTRNMIWGMYLAAQASTYLLAAIIVLFVLPGLLGMLGVASPVLLAGGGLLAFVLIREMFVVGLWYLLAAQLNADLEDFDRLTHVGLHSQSVVVLPARWIVALWRPGLQVQRTD